MIDFVITASIMGIVILGLLYKAQYMPENSGGGNEGFFDINNTRAMRGLWCIVVVLVHIPAPYQNRVQDLIGSFAYIGVTFFFMTSAYGLSVAYKNSPQMISCFWRRRLPKLLIPNWLINIIFVVLFGIVFNIQPRLLSLVDINGWVRWLIGCYIAFWIGHRFFKTISSKWVTCVLVVIGSVTFYLLKNNGLYSTTIWATEAYGFIWGIVLSSLFDSIKGFMQKRWVSKVVAFCISSLVFGIAYLKYKPVLFFGDYLLKIALGISILLFLLTLNSRIKIGNRFIWFLGDISFEVYLIHHKSFELISRIVPNVSSGVFILLAVILTIVLAAVVHVLCKEIFRLVH